MNLHPNAIKFFQKLADHHDSYPGTPEEVVYQFIREWEARDGLHKAYRVATPTKEEQAAIEEAARKENEADDKAYSEQMDAWDDWCVSPLGRDFEDCIISLPNEIRPWTIAASGPCIFIDEPDHIRGSDYVSRLIICPTWGEIAALFDDAIQITNDHRRTFLEGIYEVVDDEDWPEDLRLKPPAEGTTVYRFSTGS